MLELFTTKMRLAPSVDLERLASATDGSSGAQLKGLCTLAGRNAFVRTLAGGDTAPATGAEEPAVTHEDFEQAWRELSSAPRRRPIGFSAANEAPPE